MTFASFGRSHEPEPEQVPAAPDMGVLPAFTALVVPVLDAEQLAQVAEQIQAAIHNAVKAGFTSAMDDLAAAS
jgi:hypothetical protein